MTDRDTRGGTASCLTTFLAALLFVLVAWAGTYVWLAVS